LGSTLLRAVIGCGKGERLSLLVPTTDTLIIQGNLIDAFGYTPLSLARNERQRERGRG